MTTTQGDNTGMLWNVERNSCCQLELEHDGGCVSDAIYIWPPVGWLVGLIWPKWSFTRHSHIKELGQDNINTSDSCPPLKMEVYLSFTWPQTAKGSYIVDGLDRTRPCKWKLIFREKIYTFFKMGWLSWVDFKWSEHYLYGTLMYKVSLGIENTILFHKKWECYKNVRYCHWISEQDWNEVKVYCIIWFWCFVLLLKVKWLIW